MNSNQDKDEPILQHSDLSNTGTCNRYLVLLQQAGDEIETYRKRQISTFRETAIVQALITWGAGKLDFTETLMDITRLLASFGCVVATYVGYRIIMIFKNRIHYVRFQRSKLLRQFYNTCAQETEPIEVFYPIGNKYWDGSSIDNIFRTDPSSGIYVKAVLGVGIISSLVNLFAVLIK